MSNIKQVFPVVQPSEFQLNFAVACCSCGEDQCTMCGPNDGSCCSSDGKKSFCDCRKFNTVFTLFQTEDNPNKYRCEFGQHKPAGASCVELVLANVAKKEDGSPDKENPKYIACASVHFEDPATPTVSWISTGFGDFTRIGTMRSRVNSSNCCFPKTITCHAPPQPDFCPPHREWQATDPDDLNGSPFFPSIDIEIPEDCPEAPVRYGNGELNLRIKDLSSNGFGIPWGHTRIYSNRLSNNYDYGCGMNWLIHEQPVLVIHERKRQRAFQPNSGANAQEVTRAIAVVRGTRNTLWFDEDDWQDETTPNPAWSENRTAWKELTPRFGQSHELKHFPDEGLFRLMAPNGHVWEFYDFERRAVDEQSGKINKVANPAPGRFRRHLGPGRQAAVSVYDSQTCQLLRTERSGDGVMETFENEYITDGENFGRIRSVTHRRTGHSNPNINGNIQKVVYSYYGKCDDKCQPLEHGKCGDLRFAAVQIPDRINNTRWQNLNIHYYRHHIEGDFYGPIGKTQPENETPLWQVEQLPYCQGLVAEVFSPEDFRHLYRAIYNIQTERGDFLKIGNLTDDPNWIENLQRKLDSASIPENNARLEIGFKINRLVESTLESGDIKNEFLYGDTASDEFPQGLNLNANVLRRRIIHIRNDDSQHIFYSNLVGQPLSYSINYLLDEEYTQCFVYHRDSGNLLRVIEPSAIRSVGLAPSTTLFGDVMGFTQAPSGGDELENWQPTTIYGLEIRFKNFNSSEAGGLIQSINYSSRKPGRLPAAFSLRRYKPGATIDHYQDVFGYAWDFFKVADRYSHPLYFVKEMVRPIDDKVSVNTSRLYQWFGQTSLTKLPAIEFLTIGLPAVPKAQNGDNKTGAIRTVFDRYGYQQRQVDPRNIVTDTKYDPALGSIEEIVEDTDNLRRTTSFENDRFGRAIFVAGPKHSVLVDPMPDSTVAGRSPIQAHSTMVTRFNDIEGEVWNGAGYASTPFRGHHKFINPVSISQINRNGQSNRFIECRWIGTLYQFGNAIPNQSYWSRLVETDFDPLYRTKTEKRYYDIGFGKFQEIRVEKYDPLSRPIITVDADNTKTKIVYDVRGLELERHVGLFASNSDGDGLTPIFKHLRNDLGLPTKTTMYIGKNGCKSRDEDRIYDLEYDWRGRLLNETTQVGLSYTNEYGDRVIEEPLSVTELHAGNQGQRRESALLDARGRVYRSIVTGSYIKCGTRTTPKNTTITAFTYDQAGNIVTTQFAESDLQQQTKYDGLNRPYLTRTLWHDRELERADSCFDLADNLILRTSTEFDRNDTVADKLSNTSAMWHDPLGRTVISANYGTNVIAQRPNIAPRRSDEILVAGIRYNQRGEIDATRAPDYVSNVKGDTKLAFDDLGRNTLTIEAFNNGNITRRRTVAKSYHASNQVETLSLLNFAAPSGFSLPDVQTTRYHYGTTIGQSSIAHGSLLAKITYPDRTTTHFAYNKQGQPVNFIDQNNTRHCYTYDLFGRQTADSIQQPGKGIDVTVRRLETTYDAVGRVGSQVSYDQINGGAALNSVNQQYEDLNLISVQSQNHFGSGIAPATQFHYQSSQVSGPRLRGIDYPGMITQPWEQGYIRFGDLPRRILLDYGALDTTVDFFLNRPRNFDIQNVPSFVDSNRNDARRRLAEYRYAGTRTHVNRRFLEITRERQTVQVDDSQGHFLSRDVFGRPNRASTNAPGAALQNTFYEYDAATNIRFKKNNLARDFAHDDVYGYDQLNRLTKAVRGKLKPLPAFGSPDPCNAMSQTLAEENWNVDTAENWNSYQATSNDSRISNEFQTRTHNRINQIKKITSQTQHWITPENDSAGNMTVMPQPNDPTKKFHCKYDAWNRLVEVTGDDKVTSVARYQYDAMGRRIVKESNDQWRHYFYDASNNRVIEERVASSAIARPTLPDRQFYWRPDGRLLAADYSEIVDIRSFDPSPAPKKHARRTHRIVPIYDLLGSSVGLLKIDNSGQFDNPPTETTAGISHRLGYSSYGQIYRMNEDFSLVGPGLDNDFDFDHLFAGYRIDRETGLYNTHYRQFHPLLGTWNAQDPAGYRDSLNLYQYVLSRPMVLRDPNGGFVIIGGILLMAAIGAAIGAGTYYYTTDEEDRDFGEMLIYAAGGAAAGAIGGVAFFGAAAGFAALGTTAGYTAFGAGVVSGGAGGFASGLVTQGGLSLYQGTSFSGAFAAGLGAGIEEGLWGAAGGAIGGAVLGRYGANLKGTVLSGFTSGSIAGGLEGAVQGYRQHGIEGALSGLGSGALIGGALGSGFAFGGNLGGRLGGRIRQRPQFRHPNLDPRATRVGKFMIGTREINRSYRQPAKSKIARWLIRKGVLVGRDVEWPRDYDLRGQIIAHHQKPVILGGPDIRQNIDLVDRMIHRLKHPGLVRRGVIYY